MEVYVDSSHLHYGLFKTKIRNISPNQNSKIKHIYVLKYNLYIPDEITTTIVAARRTLNKIIQI